MRDPVIDPSHEPPERDTGIHITVRIGVGGAVMQCPVLEFALWDDIANLTIQFQLPVTLRDTGPAEPSRLIFTIPPTRCFPLVVAGPTSLSGAL